MAKQTKIQEIFKYLACGFSLSISSQLHAITDLYQHDSLEQKFIVLPPPGTTRAVFLEETQASSSHFSIGPRAFSFRGLMESFGASPFLRTKGKKINELNMEYSYFLGEFPLCRMHLTKVHSKAGYIFITGQSPDVNWSRVSFTMADFPDITTTQELLEQYLDDDIKVERELPCLHLEQNQDLVPVFETFFFNKGNYYKALVSSQDVISLNKIGFHVDGQAKVYKSNPNDNAITAEALSDLIGSGYLNSDYLTTHTGKNQRAYSESHFFDFDIGEPAFHEANVFYHTQQMHDYFSSLGYQWHVVNPITIVLDIGADESDFDVNNAYYQPSSGSKGINKGPIIVVGEGNGYVLKNLTLDADVVSHEFSHHVIFEHLNDTSNFETLTLHEGLADFFTFARSGDTCLGESICPLYSPFCMEQGACLRIGHSEVKFDDATYQSWQNQPHFRGQLISATLWDMYENGIFERKELAKIVLSALKLMPASSYLEDFLVAFTLADRDVYGLAHTCDIFSILENRGFSEFIQKYDCTSFSQKSGVGLPGEGNVISVDTATGGGVEPSNTKKNKKVLGISGCGVVMGRSQKKNVSDSIWGLMILPLFPLIGSWCLRRKYKKIH